MITVAMHCDDCGKDFGLDLANTRQAIATIRNEAAKVGWRRTVRGFDACPTCAARRKGMKFVPLPEADNPWP